MSEPSKHHHLPVLYLKQWARADGKVIRYHRPVDQVVAHPVAPKNTGFELGLYALDGFQDHRRNAIETDFLAHRVDDPAAEALRVLISCDQSRMTFGIGRAWAIFVMSLIARHPTAIEQITTSAGSDLRGRLLEDPEDYDAVRQTDDPPTLLQWVEGKKPEVLTNYGKQLLPAIVSHVPTMNAILKMRWTTLGIPSEDGDLLVSDRPVFRSHGIADERCIVAMPLSPRFLFVATLHQSTLDSVTALGPRKLARRLNELLAEQAEKNVYAAHDDHLRFVEKRLKQRAVAEATTG